MTARKEWTSRAPVRHGHGLIKGGEVLNPDGEVVARCPGKHGLIHAKHIAAAMNLTSMTERQKHISRDTGYDKICQIDVLE